MVCGNSERGILKIGNVPDPRKKLKWSVEANAGGTSIRLAHEECVVRPLPTSNVVCLVND
ncbi:hypothetical protein CON48_22630 [Bacillus thuringiensis]|uniref:Uncharacterized protein n=1 Tax=Bacillus thuringiensis TaxID=1428 RepID=A0ABD6SMK7_BACTU|nr:hypothetical protein SD98_27455 [Bacillus thuringiensis serovar morrisoni]AMR87572.1 hypothetical protein A3L20_27265 [Bacillus thuringiensis]OAK23949.1 hypothetical protein A6283_07735 [Bacillus wiedmannii]OTY26674.1 hypothetical protein BK736_34495 [Bacillus thuringiensis serovar poloniensis]OTZ26492.1 hypothetical protein BK763_30150 [Bacillus thuringiensis serovar thompsoni]